MCGQMSSCLGGEHVKTKMRKRFVFSVDEISVKVRKQRVNSVSGEQLTHQQNIHSDMEGLGADWKDLFPCGTAKQP